MNNAEKAINELISSGDLKGGMAVIQIRGENTAFVDRGINLTVGIFRKRIKYKLTDSSDKIKANIKNQIKIAERMIKNKTQGKMF